ncbi:DNA/RNA nuclease SfsA [uncultured Marivita sp.]|uniref:DNA/RNA nuclease SfsA n=1 Tax=uncultured Marivita sp. TaxID=888080 RepID=UPI0026218A1C|nr:DNA/RNA nuclease SfsA [uncultured Marivita sp.]
MRFQTPLVPGTLIRRYKRFLADVTLADGQEVTAHCANPGSMMGLAEPGTRVWLEPNDDPKKKLRFGWRLVENGNGHFTGVDTAVPNRMLRAAFEARDVPGLTEFDSLRAEVPYGEKSRFDFLLSQAGQPDLYIEVKSVTLSRQPGLAEFPDSVTARGTRHLNDLSDMVRQGHRAMMLYLVQRTDCSRMTLAEDIDPSYATAWSGATAAGVETLALDCQISPEAVRLGKPIEMIAPGGP